VGARVNGFSDREEMIPFVFYLDDAFIEGYRTTIRSLLMHNPWFNNPVIIYHPKAFTMQAVCAAYYKSTSFVEVQEGAYDHIDMSTGKHYFRQAMFKIDMFRTTAPFVYLDSDLLIVGDISEMLTMEGDIVMAKRDGHFNSGVMVVNKGDCYKDMLKFSDKAYRIPDQDLINAFFKGRIARLPDKYNVKRIKYKNFKGKDKRIVHFQKEKPWDVPTAKGEPWESWQRYAKLPDAGGKMAVVGSGSSVVRFKDFGGDKAYVVNKPPETVLRIMSFNGTLPKCELVHVVQNIKDSAFEDYKKYGIRRIQSTAFWKSAMRNPRWYPWEPELAPWFLYDRGYNQKSWNKILEGRSGGKIIEHDLRWWPLTGIFALDLAVLENCPSEVYLYGFDFYKTGWCDRPSKKMNDTLLAVGEKHLKAVVGENPNIQFKCASEYVVDAPNWENI